MKNLLNWFFLAWKYTHTEPLRHTHCTVHIRSEKFYCDNIIAHTALSLVFGSGVGWVMVQQARIRHLRQLSCWIIKGLSLMWNWECKQHVKIWKFESGASERRVQLTHSASVWFGSATWKLCSIHRAAERMCWKWQNANTIINRFTAEQNHTQKCRVAASKLKNDTVKRHTHTSERVGWVVPFFLEILCIFLPLACYEIKFFHLCLCPACFSLRRLQYIFFSMAENLAEFVLGTDMQINSLRFNLSERASVQASECV